MQISPDILTVFFEITVFSLLGLVLGSFSTALIHRIPLGKSWGVSFSREERSKCPSCQTPLGFRDLIPLLSWIIQKGRCRHCGDAIPAFYVGAEITCLLMALGIYAVYGFSVDAFFLVATVPFLAALLFIDLQHMILPNILVALLGILGIAFHAYVIARANLPVLETVQGITLAAALYAGFIYGTGWFMGKVLKKEALGMGDVKFFAVAGLWLGLKALPAFCILSGLVGVILGLFWRFRYKNALFPFGPALIVSLYILLLVKDTPFLW